MNDCQYCCGDVNMRDYLLSDGCDGVYIDGNNNLGGDDKYDFEDIKINYCPICGRKLIVNGKEQSKNLNKKSWLMNRFMKQN